MPSEALHYNKKGNLIGFGFAPEGIENNEIIYELLSDLGWTSKEIGINDWIAKYCRNRYGAFPDNMKQAFEYFNKSCFGSFTDHPRNAYQFRPNSKHKGSINTSDDFRKGVELFLNCKDNFKENKLYGIDAIEFTCQYLGLKADELLAQFQTGGESNYSLLEDALSIMTDIDRLLESHPNWKLQNWTNYARGWGNTIQEKNYYEANARRLITTWGGGINEYAAKTWSGLIRDYYIPRWRAYYDAKKNITSFDIKAWEEKWIKATTISKTEPFKNAVETASRLFNEQANKK
jgi:alpha-N-acetylglucosaminidase